MIENRKEKISALIDGEISISDSIELTSEINKSVDDENLSARYQLIGSVLRGESMNPQKLSLLHSVQEQLENEPTVLAPVTTKKKESGWLATAIGGAIAASVAIISVNSLVKTDLSIEPETILTTNIASNSALISPNSTDITNSKTQTNNKFDKYIVDHNEFSSPAAPSGIMSYSTLVSYDSKR